MAESPITAVLAAIDALDPDAVAALFAPDGRLLTADARTASGQEEVRRLARHFFADLRATRHRMTAEWNPSPDIWIGELQADYELSNYAELGPYARAAILRNSEQGIHELRIYGLHERPLTDSTRGYQEVFGSGHWLPTL